jgi:hypothetical protein
MFARSIRIAVFAASLVFAAASAHADVVSDPWASWSDSFTTTMTSCVATAQVGCLAKAFTSLDRPAAVSDAPADELYRDLRTAEVLLHQKDASDAMWKLYGIDSSAYLGTGYSVPLAGEGAKNYEFATQREYFVPNLCAEAVDPVVCPKKDANIWTWRLTSAQLTQWADKPIVKLLRTLAPTSDAQTFPKNPSAAPKPNLPPMLIRFGSLPLAYYKGTFGRPDASRVFFADYEQARGKTLRAAMTATGASTLLDNPDPAKTFFIWIYAPDANSKASVASWAELFRLLSAPQ